MRTLFSNQRPLIAAVLFLPLVALIGLAGGQKEEVTEKGKEEEVIPADPRDELTDLQYYVTCQDGTEPPFRNAYWDNKQPGIYVDVISGKPLFSSTDKYASGSGWPSFTKPLEEEEIEEHTDRSLGMPRTEVRSKTSDAHLGHVFPDGPAPTGLRYCVNSASLRFIPVDELEDAGYGQYLKLFEADKK